MRQIWTLHAATFVFFFALGLGIPVLPVYLSQEFGIGSAWIGWAVGLMPLAGILLRPWSGWISDGLSRKWPTVLGVAISGLAGLLYFGPLPLVLLARACQGLGIALYAPASLAMTSDLAPEGKLTGIMSTRNLLLGVSLMAGSAAGGVLQETLGYAGVFGLMALVQLAFVPFLLGFPETLVERSRAAWWVGYREVVKIRPILAATLGNMGFAGVFATLQAFYPLILVDAGFGTALVGAFFGFYSFVSVLARIPAGPLAERFQAERVSLWGFGIALAGLVVLWAAPLPPLAWVAGALLGTGSGLYLPANLVSVSQHAPRRVRGSAFSLYTTSWDVGGLIGPVVAGGVAGVFASNLAVLPLAVVLAAAVIAGYLAMSGVRLLRLPRAAAGD